MRGLVAVPNGTPLLKVLTRASTEEELRRGPGHLAGSALPGGRGNCIIAGHRDTHFRVLKNIRKGDDIVLETRNGQFLYRVKSATESHERVVGEEQLARGRRDG